MLYNYHTHTLRCNHATGSEREYVEQAIQDGLQALGFSDHAPYVFPNGYESWFRMKPAQLEDYFTVLTDLRQEYAGQIELHIGLEAEYYPACFETLLRLLEPFPCEYLILGQHFTENECDGIYVGKIQDQEVLFRGCVDQLLDGLRTGRFLYLAHPDLLSWAGDELVYEREIARLCRGAKSLDIPLEINLQGIAEQRFYPTERFWKIAGTVGNAVVLGSDAHRPGDIWRPEAEAAARAMAARHGLQIIEKVI